MQFVKNFQLFMQAGFYSLLSVLCYFQQEKKQR